MRDQKLRIAFVTREYVTEDTFDSGMANYVYRVARGLTELGHDVHVVTLSERDAAEFEHRKITVHRVKVSNFWLRLNSITRYRLPRSFHLIGLNIRMFRMLKELHDTRPLDLIQAPHSPFCGLGSLLLLRVPHVFRVSWYEPLWTEFSHERLNADARIVHLLETLQLRMSRHLCTPSATLRESLVSRLGRNDVRVVPTPCFIESATLDDSVYRQSLSGRKYLLFFGRFELRKGFHILVDAAAAFLTRQTDAHIALVGRDLSSSLASSMCDYARSRLSAFSDRVTILDRVPAAQLYPIIKHSHLVVLPSLMDNVPNACIEAMALGKPVIGTRGASFEELIDDEETGFLVPLDSVEALSEKMTSAWTHPRLKEIGDAAQRASLNYAPDQTVAKLVEFYREVLSQSRA
jgi:glycosyltransferase involved in cell wall biosynthesis